jgi:hypothetical protein
MGFYPSSMRTGLMTAAAALAIAGAGVAVAASPHFLFASNQGIAPGTFTDTITFKIAGLGDTVTTTVTATADAVAVYACRNNGGNFPSDPKKQVSTGTVSASGTFTSGKNGSITGGLTLSPPASTLTCPGGQSEVTACVEYENKAVSEPAAGTEPAQPGSASVVAANLPASVQSACETAFANNP